MVVVKFLKPINQPDDSSRILDWIKTNLHISDYDRFRFTTAFSNIKPYHKLDGDIKNWLNNNKTIEAIYGLDFRQTTKEALQYALDNFDKTYVINNAGNTYHPKFYLFDGKNRADFYFGSNNFTSGGLETNFESGVFVGELNLDDDKQLYDEGVSCFDSLLPDNLCCTRLLTQDLLEELVNAGVVVDEANNNYGSVGSKMSSAARRATSAIFNHYRTVPAMSVPRSSKSGVGVAPYLKKSTKTDTLVIQVIPHGNNEVFLSLNLVKENPDFFQFPFTGVTKPKKSKNDAYPQRCPDPIVNVYIHGEDDKVVKTLLKYNLNTVYNSNKHDVRITISGIYEDTPENSILVMSYSNDCDCEYDLHFYRPGTIMYNRYLAVCDRELPRGSAAVGRKAGWL